MWLQGGSLEDINQAQMTAPLDPDLWMITLAGEITDEAVTRANTLLTLYDHRYCQQHEELLSFLDMLKEAMLGCRDESVEDLTKGMDSLPSLACLEEPKVTLWVATCGGDLDATLGLCDVMHTLSVPIQIVVAGKALSAGTVIVAAGQKGRRLAYPNSTFMLHPMQLGWHGEDRNAESILGNWRQSREKYIAMLAKCTEQPKKKIDKLCDKDTWLSATEAQELNIIDEIIGGD